MQDPANIHTEKPRREPPPRKPHDPVYDPPLTAYEQMRERHIAKAVAAWPEPPPRKRN
jgi:hypothetical protein